MQIAEPLTLPKCLHKSAAYALVRELYRDRVAERSQVPLIRHIIEGVTILERINASSSAIEAFCLHPLVQADDDLLLRFEYLSGYKAVKSKTLGLALEYRNVANAFLSDKVVQDPDNMGHDVVYATISVRLSPLKDVNDMLIADKIQNRKDFLLYHKDTHPRSRELDYYFNLWLKALDISEDRYQELTAGL